MKMKFNPNVAYFTGLWKTRKVREGIGVTGDPDTQKIFITQAIKTLGIPPEKIRVQGNKVFFYHSAYRRDLQKIISDELEIFKWENEYSGNYVAGLYDGCGGIDEKRKAVFLARVDDADQLLLERIGIMTRRFGFSVYILKKSVPKFIALIAKFVKREETKSRLWALMRSGNERDPR